MRYHNITKDDMRNGPGLRVVLWVAGCSHHCPHCHNPITWDPNYGLIFDENAKKEIFEQLDKDYISGITLSGGDPLFTGNRSEITDLCKEIKEKYPNKTIWSYTGYNFEQVKMLPVMKYIDVLLDGEFKIDLFSPEKHWVGSSNQRVIDVQKSLKENRIVLFEK